MNFLSNSLFKLIFRSLLVFPETVIFVSYFLYLMKLVGGRNFRRLHWPPCLASHDDPAISLHV